MAQSLTIQLPDNLQQSLLIHAAKTHLTLEQLILQTLSQEFLQPTAQPLTGSSDAEQLLSLIGTLDLGTTDLAENHDRYLSEALSQDLRNVE